MSGTHVMDVTEQSFNQDVVQASMQVPVLVDFWAEWCGPCKTLGPNLEQLAGEYAGAFKLAKVNVDQEQRLAGMFGVQSIPTVYIVYQGQPLDQFAGALPLTELRRLIDALLDRLGVTPPAPEGPPTEPEAALAYWAAKLQENAGDTEARLQLGRLLVAAGELDSGREQLESIEASQPEYNAAQAALATLDLASAVSEAGGEEAVRAKLAADPEDGRARYLVACADASAGRFVSALDALVSLVGAGPKDIRPDAKSAAATVFEAAGREDPEVEALRRKLARLLF